MNADTIARKMCELLTARQVFMVYTKTQQYLVVSSYSTFDVTVGGLIATFEKATTDVSVEDGYVNFKCGNSLFMLREDDVLKIDRF